MKAAQVGNVVTVHYCGKFDDGEVFDESYGRDPLKFSIGSHQVIEGFENGIVGMEIGQKNLIHIPAAEAYGEWEESMIFSLGKENFPEDYEAKIGDELTLYQSEDESIQVIVNKIEGNSIVLDANHPLAGKDLHFDIELLEIHN
jgi:peptidylprolyl isomerase